MTAFFARLLAVGLAALLLAAPLAVEQPAEAQDDAFEQEELSSRSGEALARGPDPDARFLGDETSSPCGSFDSTVSSRSLSRPPPGSVR